MSEHNTPGQHKHTSTSRAREASKEKHVEVTENPGRPGNATEQEQAGRNNAGKKNFRAETARESVEARDEDS